MYVSGGVYRKEWDSGYFSLLRGEHGYPLVSEDPLDLYHATRLHGHVYWLDFDESMLFLEIASEAAEQSGVVAPNAVLLLDPDDDDQELDFGDDFEEALTEATYYF